MASVPHGRPRVSQVEGRDEQSRQKELRKIKEYRELAELVNTKIFEKQFTIEILALISKLLRENPEYYTIWNYRRLVLHHQLNQAELSPEEAPSSTGSFPQRQQNIVDLITDDLQFAIPLLIKYPKCYWIWNHRIWLLNQAIERLPVSSARQVLQNELDLDTKMLARDARNFHGWSYRRLIVAKLETLPTSLPSSQASNTTMGQSMVEAEFAYTTKMIRTNLSNFSAWHNRSKLIPRLLSERGADSEARRSMLESEFELMQHALCEPNDQSVWKYHQFLMSTLAPDAPRDAVIVQDLTNHDRVRYYEQELANIRDLLEDWDDCKWVYQALLQYSALYLEIDGGNRMVTTIEMREWLRKLRELDPLRVGRWDDLERNLGL